MHMVSAAPCSYSVPYIVCSDVSKGHQISFEPAVWLGCAGLLFHRLVFDSFYMLFIVQFLYMFRLEESSSF